MADKKKTDRQKASETNAIDALTDCEALLRMVTARVANLRATLKNGSASAWNVSAHADHLRENLLHLAAVPFYAPDVAEDVTRRAVIEAAREGLREAQLLEAQLLEAQQ
jgi:hypothetical protein